MKNLFIMEDGRSSDEAEEDDRMKEKEDGRSGDAAEPQQNRSEELGANDGGEQSDAVPSEPEGSEGPCEDPGEMVRNDNQTLNAEISSVRQ